MASAGERGRGGIELPGGRRFEPVRYRPMPSHVAGLNEFMISLDGKWKIYPTPGENLRAKPLDAQWKDIQVPGQWRQQGFDLPRDKTVAMAKEFSLPADWAGRRVFLRFNAIHAGTHYWINGKPLGYSENLFTPVEWEITEQARIGGKNRLDLEMKVDTVSEKLSVASDYVFHNLGGIDRSVSVFALPKLHVRSLKVATDLDRDYRDAALKLGVTLDNPSQRQVDGLSLEVSLQGPDGKPAEYSVSKVKLAPAETGESTREIVTQVKNPLKWNAEKPHLYKLTLARHRGRVLAPQLRDETLKPPHRIPPALAGTEVHALAASTGRAAEQQLLLGCRELAPRDIERDVVLVGDGLEEQVVVVGCAVRPGNQRAAGERALGIDQQIRVDLGHKPEAGAGRARTVRVVEREDPRGELGQGGAVLDGEFLRVGPGLLVAAHLLDPDQTVGELGRGLEALGQAAAQIVAHDQAIDHDLDGVLVGLGKRGHIVKELDRPVDRDPGEALAPDLLEDVLVFP